VDWMNVVQDRDHWRVLINDGNEPSGSIKDGEFHDKPSDYQLLKKDCVPWSQSFTLLR
jgi:hypothetical protein